MREVSACYPYLVWEEQGVLLGYALCPCPCRPPRLPVERRADGLPPPGGSPPGAGLPAVRRLVRLAAASGGRAQCTAASPRRTPPVWLSTRPWASRRLGALPRWAISTAVGWMCSGWKIHRSPRGSPSPWCPSPGGRRGRRPGAPSLGSSPLRYENQAGLCPAFSHFLETPVDKRCAIQYTINP